jgi:hypothetical protein
MKLPDLIEPECSLKLVLDPVLIPLYLVHFFTTYFRKMYFNIVAYLLKARIVKPAETAVDREALCKHARC